MPYPGMVAVKRWSVLEGTFNDRLLRLGYTVWRLENSAGWGCTIHLAGPDVETVEVPIPTGVSGSRSVWDYVVGRVDR